MLLGEVIYITQLKQLELVSSLSPRWCWMSLWQETSSVSNTVHTHDWISQSVEGPRRHVEPNQCQCYFFPVALICIGDGSRRWTHGRSEGPEERTTSNRKKTDLRDFEVPFLRHRPVFVLIGSTVWLIKERIPTKTSTHTDAIRCWSIACMSYKLVLSGVDQRMKELLAGQLHAQTGRHLL